MAENFGISFCDGKLWHPKNVGLGPCFGHDTIQVDLNSRSSKNSPFIMVH